MAIPAHGHTRPESRPPAAGGEARRNFGTYRRIEPARDDDAGMSDDARADPGPPELLAIYDAALPQVYGYLVRRCDSAAVAEDPTSGPAGDRRMLLGRSLHATEALLVRARIAFRRSYTEEDHHTEEGRSR